VTAAARPSATTRGGGAGVPLAVAIGFLAFLAAPVAWLVLRSATDGSLASAAFDRIVLDALRLSLITTGLSLLVIIGAGTPVAYLLARGRIRPATLVETLVDLPIVLPPSVAGLSLLLLFGRSGPIGGPLADAGLHLPFTSAAVVMAQVFVAAPFYVRAARAGFALVDRDLEDAARVDGARELAVVRHVTLPLARSALAGGLVLAWGRALGEFGATIMFAGNVLGETQTLPLVVYAEFQSSLEAAIAAGAVLVLAAFGILALARWVRWPPAGARL